jgi:hypothetical protein
VAAQCKSVLGNLDPTLAGAALMAIQLCKSLGFRRAHFEGDTKLVVDGVNSSNGDGSRTGMLVEDITQELRSIPQWCMTFTGI